MRNILIALFIVISSICLHADSETFEYTALAPENHHRLVSQVISDVLIQQHYKKRAIDDSLSSEMFDRYIEKLDPQRWYFLESDIRSFEKHRYMFDDYIRSGQVQAAYDIFNVYRTRFAERMEYVYKRLDTEFDFTVDEYIEVDRESAPWAKTSAELDEIWRKRLKYEALNLKLAGKNWEGITTTLHKRYKRIHKNTMQVKSEDVFELIMNSFTECFDPHTNYFSPQNSENFNIRMSQSLEGIGARLTTENDFTKVVEIVPGGPADKSKKLRTDDQIMGVAQGADGEMVDVIGWRIDEVVQLIRGKKGTVVRLQVLKADALPGSPPDTISLVRDKIKLEDQSAKSDTIQIHDKGENLTFGIIEIPAFYADFEGMRRGERDYKSTTRDVQRLLNELKQEHVDGIIIDLRGNGGGFLNEAVDLTGLFIDSGPVVQVKSTTGRIKVEQDFDPGIFYDGPLVVVVDRLSASASEIFAAAIQDYDRGIIIGSQSYGKGTVQNALSLDRYIRRPNIELGQIKFTTAKFYRITGGSTQHVGVVPDISFPSQYNLMDIGESSRKNALLWDQIAAVKFKRAGHVSDLIPRLQRSHNVRLANNAKYAALVADLQEFEESRNKERISLNEAVLKKEREKIRKDESQSEEEDDADPFHDQDNTKIRKDLLLKESAEVLGDYISLVEHKVN